MIDGKTVAIISLSIALVFSVLYNVGTEEDWSNSYNELEIDFYELYNSYYENHIMYEDSLYDIQAGDLVYASHSGLIIGGYTRENEYNYIENDYLYYGYFEE
tara:strand:- start:12 stop:317 length:306 start_codon:yes stop_codon:yes gene_type:complete